MVVGEVSIGGTVPGPAEAVPSVPDRVDRELAEVLLEVNRLRTQHGADPLYELPKGRPAFDLDSSCVLQNAFADIGVAFVDYRSCVGRRLYFEHNLGPFIRKFDAGEYPQLIEPPR